MGVALLDVPVVQLLDIGDKVQFGTRGQNVRVLCEEVVGDDSGAGVKVKRERVSNWCNALRVNAYQSHSILTSSCGSWP